MNPKIEEFFRLWDRAKRAHENSANARDYEAEFEGVLKFLLTAEVDQSELESAMVGIYRDPNQSVADLFEFCMATLRWERFKAELERDLAHAKDMRRRTVASNILSAYSDKWDGSEVYRYYSDSPPTRRLSPRSEGKGSR